MKNKYNPFPFTLDRKTWKNNFFYVILPCIIMLFFTCAGKEVDGPGMEFTKEIYDFGKAVEDEIVNYAFKFKNNGTETLVIENVKPTCSCIHIKEYDKKVQPGASGKITVELKTYGYKGKISKIIKVITNIPDKKEIVLTMRGTVNASVSVTPDVLWLVRKDRTTSSLSGRFTITNNTDTPLKILSITPPHKNATADIITLKVNKEYQVGITINPPFHYGKTEEMFRIQTNIPEREYITLRYAYTIHADVIVYPRSIILEPGAAGTSFEKIINVDNYFSAPISIINPRVPGGTLKYTIEEPVKGKTYLIKLLFPARFVLKENESLVFSFEVQKDQILLKYNIPIEVSK